jgi:hypothetical protein
MKHAYKVIFWLIAITTMGIVLILAWQAFGPAITGGIGAVFGLALFGGGSKRHGAEVPGDRSAISEAGERNREAGAAAKESVGELKRGSIDIEATVKRIEGHHTDIGNTANELGSLADQIRRGVEEGSKPPETGTKP